MSDIVGPDFGVAFVVRLAGVSFAALAIANHAMAAEVIVSAGESIGAVNAPTRYVRNAGTIDGVGTSAIFTTGQDPISGGASIQNSGTIRSNSASPTIQIYGGIANTVFNTGVVRNTGSGLGILSTLQVSVYNQQGGLIETAGGAAVSSPDRLLLTNSGSIVGDILGGGRDDAIVLRDPDTGVAGTITGLISLGGGDDRVTGVGIDSSTGGILGVSGGIDGGAGSDTLGLAFDSDTTLTTVLLPSNFEWLEIRSAEGQTISLGAGYSGPTNIIATGNGTIDNLANLNGVGPIIQGDLGGTNLINSGSISSTIVAPLDAAVILSSSYNLTNNGSITATGGAAVRDNFDSQIVNNGTIRSVGGTGVMLSSPRSALTNSGTITGDIAGVSASSDISILNSGQISSMTGAGMLLGGSVNVENNAGGIISGETLAIGRAPTFAGTFRIRNAGTINGSVDLTTSEIYGASVDIYAALPGGVVNGDLRLGSGDDQILVELSGGTTGQIATGAVDGGDGFDFLSYRTTDTNSVDIPVSLLGFEELRLEADGAGSSLSAGGTLAEIPIVTSGTGNVILGFDMTVSGRSALSASAATTTNQGQINAAFAGDAVVTASGTALENSGAIVNSGGTAIGVNGSFSGNRPIITNLAGGLIQGSDTAIRLVTACTFCSAVGSVEVQNAGSIVGDVDLRTPFALDSVYTSSGSLVGDLLLGNGNDLVLQEADGRIEGSVELGAGDDRFDAHAGSSVDGLVDGGEDVDTLALYFAGTTAAPASIDLISFQNFEALEIHDGVGSVDGTSTFDRIEVLGGRLIGNAGSTLAGAVSVANGATFGSAGTVVGNIAVASGGTLSPGASPGVMTVNGNVSLAAGSSTVFEFVPSPGQSDQLVIEGSLGVASGASLSLTGNRPLTPGVGYDLITASDGITGSFTVNQAATVQGFLRQTANSLQLLGTFVAGAGTSAQAEAAIDYVNAVLIAGGGGAPLFAAIPSLLNADGTANAAAFGQVSPEPYATASQLGVEQGLTIAKAGRSGFAATSRAEPGLFSFAQGMGDWRRLKGNAGTGTSSAKSHSYGLLGGLGFGSGTGSVGAFVGYIDSRQTIAGLGARTNADGLVAGLAGHFAAGGFDVNALLAYDWSDASTRRTVPGAATAASDYNLRSLVLDASAGYNLSLANGWAVRPEVGVTHVSTRRGAALEIGSAAFALTVDADRAKATFVDGGIKLRGGQAEGSTFHPWAMAGVRYQIEGELTAARAGFVGSATRFAALGAGRKETMATAGAGFSVDLDAGVSLYGAYLGEFGGGRSHNVNVGIRFEL